MRKELRDFSAKLGTRPYYAVRAIEEVYDFLRSIRSPFKKNVDISRDIYNKYDDREQRDYESASWQCIRDNKVAVLSAKEIRDIYLDYLYYELDEIRPSRILEVGCGNCINLVNLKERYPKAEIHGLDVSSGRLEVSKKYWGERLNGVKLHNQSITSITNWRNKYFDAVFSVHCIEQISEPEETTRAVAEMARITSGKVVMIEPVYENCNISQKLYLHNADHVRGLLGSVRSLGLEPVRNEVTSIQSNPVCNSTILVLDRRYPADAYKHPRMA